VPRRSGLGRRCDLPYQMRCMGVLHHQATPCGEWKSRRIQGISPGIQPLVVDDPEVGPLPEVVPEACVDGGQFGHVAVLGQGAQGSGTLASRRGDGAERRKLKAPFRGPVTSRDDQSRGVPAYDLRRRPGPRSRVAAAVGAVRQAARLTSSRRAYSTASTTSLPLMS
jgi:hypothetical protein